MSNESCSHEIASCGNVFFYPFRISGYRDRFNAAFVVSPSVSVHLRIGHPPHEENTLGLLVDDHEQEWMISLEDHRLGRHP
jgi:hypothetical protein